MKFTESQKELLALLPSKIRKSDELNDSAKLVLANIIFGFGMDKAKENDYVYKSDDEMANDCGISKSTVGVAVRQLEINNYIEVKRGKRGKRGEASEYRLTEKSNLKSNFQIAEKSNFQVFENELIKLKNEIIELKIELSKLNLKSNTDTESDKEINNTSFNTCTCNTSTSNEIKSNNNLDTCTCNTSSSAESSGEEPINNNFFNEEGENEMSDNGAIEENVESKMENESSECDTQNITSLPTADEEKDTVQLDKDRTQNVVKNNYCAAATDYSKWYNEFGVLFIQNTLYSSPQAYIDQLKKNMDLAKEQMMASKFCNEWENIRNFETQYEYFLTQLQNLKIFDKKEYLNYRKFVMIPWWNKTKEYFPKGWEKSVDKIINKNKFKTLRCKG